MTDSNQNMEISDQKTEGNGSNGEKQETKEDDHQLKKELEDFWKHFQIPFVLQRLKEAQTAFSSLSSSLAPSSSASTSTTETSTKFTEALNKPSRTIDFLDKKKKDYEKFQLEEKQTLLTALKDLFHFYFSDSNLSKDRFLKSQIDSDTNGYVSLELMLNSFNKVKELTSSLDPLVEALKSSDFLELSPDRHRVRRIKPFTEVLDSDPKTIYIEGVGKHAKHSDLMAEFVQYGTVTYISLPKNPYTTGNKGFAFIEFEKEEAAKNALKELIASDIMNTCHYSKFMSKAEWMERKRDKKQMEEDKIQNRIPKGTIVHFTNLPANPSQPFSRMMIRRLFETIGEVVYVDFTEGLTEGAIRFGSPETAQKCLKEYENNEYFKAFVNPQKHNFKLFLLEGGKEEEYINKVLEDRRAQQINRRKTFKASLAKSSEHDHHHSGDRSENNHNNEDKNEDENKNENINKNKKTNRSNRKQNQSESENQTETSHGDHQDHGGDQEGENGQESFERTSGDSQKRKRVDQSLNTKRKKSKKKPVHLKFE